ncbi:MAG: EAL domain-containing protein [Desulfobulbaceae bacterium]|nr:MAG: EAL domain-containing protein [Desulfobulbaceae bacterium]
MEQFIARQPILNAHKKLHGYELLYRGANDYLLADVTGERATASLLSSVFLTRDIKEISSFHPCFINFTQDLIEKNIPAAFPASQIVVEIIENVQPTKRVLGVCRRLREEGYQIALDDFVFDRTLLPLIELASIIKIDVRLTPLDMITRTLNILANYNVKLLAEKVETQKDFERASKMGFSYFQGYFFSKPERIEITELSAVKVNLLQLLHEVTRKKTTFGKLHDIISNDIAISYKLFRFLNSAYFARLQKVKTVKHAIAYLGEKELRRFLMLVIISEIASDNPGELVRLVLVRAKFCEMLGQASPHADLASELYLTGLFSALDTMLGVPMKQVVDDLPINAIVKDALIDKQGVCAAFLDIAKAVERDQHDQVKTQLAQLVVPEEALLECYLKSIQYANGLY